MMTDFEEIEFVVEDDHRYQSHELDSEFELVVTPETETQDKYGGKECPCKCHEEVANPQFQSRINHCASCGTKFINGKVYIKIGKKLKPARVIFHRPTEIQDSKKTCEKPDQTTFKVQENVIKNIPKKSDVAAKLKPKETEELSPKVDYNSSGLNLSNNFNRNENDKVLSTAGIKVSSGSPRKSSASSVSKVNKSLIKPKTVIENTMMPMVTGNHSESDPTDFKSVLNVEIKSEDIKNDDAFKTTENECAESKITGLGSESGIVCAGSGPTDAVEGSSKSSAGDRCRKRKLSADNNKSTKISKSSANNEKSGNQNWSREDDRLLLLSCKEQGASSDVFQTVANQINKSVLQVKLRFETLMELYAADNTTNDDSSDDGGI